ncbi:MAG: tetratricopeptide repeat protein, partial [Nitrospinota bacterium]
MAAVSPYRKFLKEAPSHRLRPEALYKVGHCQFREGKFREAIKALDSFVRDFPSEPRSPWALFLSAEAHLKLKEKEEALKRYLAVDARYSGSPPHKGSLAKAASLKFASRAYTEALALLRKLKRLGPEPEQRALVAFLEAESLFGLKKYEDAEKAYGLFIKSHAKSPDVPEALFKRGLSAYRAGRVREALEHIEGGLARMTPRQRKEAFYLAARGSEKVGSLRKAASFWGLFLKESKGDPREAEALLSLALARYGLKNYAGAASALKIWLKRFAKRPERREVYLLLGHALLGAGDFKGAARAYESLFAQGFVPTGAIFNLAYAYDKLGETEKAFETFRRYLKARPGAEDEGEVALRMGILALELGKDKEAREAFERASRKGKGALRSEARFRLAELKLKGGRRGEALKLLLALSKEGAEPWAGEAALRAGALLEEGKRWREALRLYRLIPKGSKVWRQAQERIGKIDAYLKAREKVGEGKRP